MRTPVISVTALLVASGSLLHAQSIAIGRRGGHLSFAQRSEPKTLNPLIAVDTSSRRILALLNADLIHINRQTRETEPALAQTWSASANKREYTVKLRPGLRFSDGTPCSADDVIFSFQLYLDEKTGSSQRDLLVVNGKPIQVSKLGPATVRFTLASDFAAAERLFDSVFILPKHLLAEAYGNGVANKVWPLTVPPHMIAGLGPFRVKQYVSGERLVLERNPYYWKKDEAGNSLPYLDALTAEFTGSAAGDAMRFAGGQVDIVDRLPSADFQALDRYAHSRHLRLLDLGPGLDFQFLFFNLNGDRRLRPALPDVDVARCFRDLTFRRAVATAIDRRALVRLAYSGRAYPLASFVPPGDTRWVNNNIPAWNYSIAQARSILKGGGYGWNAQGRLESAPGKVLQFSLITSASNPQQQAMATLIQQDLKKIGIGINVVALEFRSLIDRIFKTFDYEAAIMALANEDADPNSEFNVWTSGGGSHVWDLVRSSGITNWQNEIDGLMRQQMITTDYRQRKSLYDRVQELVWRNLPVICLLSPNILVGAKESVANFHPVILDDHTLWNAERIFIPRS